MEVLRTENLTKEYGIGDNKVIALDHVSLTINEGEFVSLEQLNDTYKNINNKNKQIYKYKFKNNLCSYNEYCLYEGKWVDEL